jgi:hypothetical protein
MRYNLLHRTLNLHSCRLEAWTFKYGGDETQGKIWDASPRQNQFISQAALCVTSGDEGFFCAHTISSLKAAKWWEVHNRTHIPCQENWSEGEVPEVLLNQQTIVYRHFQQEARNTFCSWWKQKQCPRLTLKEQTWVYSSTNGNESRKSLLISALDGGEWSASRPGRFNPREIASGTQWIGGCIAPRNILDAVEKRKIFSPIIREQYCGI